MKNKPVISVDVYEDYDLLYEGVSLLMFRADTAPPHVAVLINGELYHLSAVSGVNKRISVDALGKMFTSGKAMLLFKLAIPASKGASYVGRMEASLAQFTSEDEVVSCLAPIKLFLEKAFDISLDDKEFIFELIPFLEEKGLIDLVVAFNMIDLIQDDLFVFQQYTSEAIMDRIKSLKSGGRA